MGAGPAVIVMARPGPIPTPLFSVLVAVVRPAPALLRQTIDAVLAQEFTGWELLLIDDASADSATIELLTVAESGGRVHVLRRPESGGTAAALNDGITAARGAFVVVVDAGDVLVPTALASVAAELETRPDVELIYTDEADLSPTGVLDREFRKPEFSPERLRGQMYIGRLAAYRASVLRDIGGFRSGFDGAEDYDLALRVTELTESSRRARAIAHLPEVLYHRLRPIGVPVEEPLAAAQRAITDHLERTGRRGTVEPVPESGVYRVRYELSDLPLISIVIPSNGSMALVRGESRRMVVEAVRSIVAKTTYPHFEMVIVLDDPAPDGLQLQLADAGGDRVRIVPWFGAFNFSAKINRGVLCSAGRFVVMLNDDIEVITPDWLEVLLGLAQQHDVGMVGPMLYFEDGSIQHAGQAMHHGGPGHIGYHAPSDAAGPYDAYRVNREVGGVTAACAMVRRSVFLDVGGLSLDLPVNFNDVDFGQKLRNVGKRILWTPHAQLYHYESKTRVAVVASYEINTLNGRWGRLLGLDPYWHHVGADGQPTR